MFAAPTIWLAIARVLLLAFMLYSLAAVSLSLMAKFQNLSNPGAKHENRVSLLWPYLPTASAVGNRFGHPTRCCNRYDISSQPPLPGLLLG